MSCLACEAAQELNDDGYAHNTTGRAYVRVGNGNVELVGCVEHVAELVTERRRQAPVHVHRGHQDLADRATKALDVIEHAPGHPGHHEAALALDFTKALFAATTYLGELETLAETLRRGAELVAQYHPGLLDEPCAVCGHHPGAALHAEEPPHDRYPEAHCIACNHWHGNGGCDLAACSCRNAPVNYLDPEDPPEPAEPAADCLNCDGSGCEDCRPVVLGEDEP